jgi:hypothetical protein
MKKMGAENIQKYYAIIKSELKRCEIPGWSNTGGTGPFVFDADISLTGANQTRRTITVEGKYKNLESLIVPEAKCFLYLCDDRESGLLFRRYEENGIA